MGEDAGGGVERAGAWESESRFWSLKLRILCR